MSTRHDADIFQQFSKTKKPGLRLALSGEQEPDRETEQASWGMETFHPWTEGEKRPYQAVVSNRSREPIDAIRFYCEDGETIHQPLNSFLYTVTSSSHQRLSLVYTQHTIWLKGRNLRTLLGHLQHGRVIALIAFHEAYHLEPESENAPYIREITQETPKVE